MQSSRDPNEAIEGPTTIEEKKPNSTTTLNVLLAILLRSSALSIDNLSKRGQLYPHSIGLKDIPDLLFMQSRNASFVKKLKTAYSGYSFSLVYKGLQATIFYYSIETVNKKTQAWVGKNIYADILSALGTSLFQTGLLQIPSVVKVRLQAKPSITVWQAFANNTQYRYPWHVPRGQLISSLSKSDLKAGAAVSFYRNFSYFALSTVVSNYMLNQFLTHKILGDTENPTKKQKELSKLCGGVFGVFGSVCFDNVKTLYQVQGWPKDKVKPSIVSMIHNQYKQHGFFRIVRAAFPSAVAEFVGLGSYIIGMNAIDKVNEIQQSISEVNERKNTVNKK